mmetsp:Transcript_22508/g.73126  ORF Transcript_22508/g.73126 Transcript_22508/m.73126 type:complete len:250 (-) Transcript_22508:1082-1831(-)
MCNALLSLKVLERCCLFSVASMIPTCSSLCVASTLEAVKATHASTVLGCSTRDEMYSTPLTYRTLFEGLMRAKPQISLEPETEDHVTDGRPVVEIVAAATARREEGTQLAMKSPLAPSTRSVERSSALLAQRTNKPPSKEGIFSAAAIVHCKKTKPAAAGEPPCGSRATLAAWHISRKEPPPKKPTPGIEKLACKRMLASETCTRARISIGCGRVSDHAAVIARLRKVVDGSSNGGAESRASRRCEFEP